MNNNILKVVTDVLATVALVALGAGPVSAARSSYGAHVYKDSGSVYEYNMVTTPNSKLVVQHNEHSGYGKDSFWKIASHGHELMDDEGTKETHGKYSYSDSSGSKSEYSFHASKGKTQERSRSKGGH
jgi:hypothetical protein